MFQGNMKGNPWAFLEPTQHGAHLRATNARRAPSQGHVSNNKPVPTPESATLHNDTNPLFSSLPKSAVCIEISVFRMEIVI